jgi:hypothetical protein
LVTRDAGVVHENVDLAELGDGGFDRRLDLLFVGDVEGEGRGLTAACGNLIYQLLQLLLIASGYNYRRASSGKFRRTGASNALRSAGHERHPI